MEKGTEWIANSVTAAAAAAAAIFHACWFTIRSQRNTAMTFYCLAVVCDNKKRHAQLPHRSWDLVMPMHGPAIWQMNTNRCHGEHTRRQQQPSQIRVVWCVRRCECVSVYACAKEMTAQRTTTTTTRTNDHLALWSFQFNFSSSSSLHYVFFSVFSLFQWYAKFCTIFTTQCQTLLFSAATVAVAAAAAAVCYWESSIVFSRRNFRIYVIHKCSLYITCTEHSGKYKI